MFRRVGDGAGNYSVQGGIMKVQLVTPPTIEPITLIELKGHLRIDSGTFVGNIESSQSIAPGSHVTTTLYGLVGAAVEVVGKQAVVYFESGTNGATGTVDIKVQESDDNIVWADWATGAFTQVTTANDNATYEKAYTGVKRYIRVAAKILLAACEFGVSIVVESAVTAQDDDLMDLIEDGRLEVENVTRRALLTQTWEYFLDRFPCGDSIWLPFGNLQTVESFDYTTTAGDLVSLVENTDYTVETNGEMIGRVVLPYGVSWPGVTLAPSNPIVIRFTCGWLSADAVPKSLKRAVKFVAEDLYYHGDRKEVLTRVINGLLVSYKLWEEF
jgi:uncharacterized phiE125 gp8 family phage protein